MIFSWWFDYCFCFLYLLYSFIVCCVCAVNLVKCLCFGFMGKGMCCFAVWEGTVGLIMAIECFCEEAVCLLMVYK